MDGDGYAEEISPGYDFCSFFFFACIRWRSILCLWIASSHQPWGFPVATFDDRRVLIVGSIGKVSIVSLCFTMFHYVSLCFTMFHYVSLCFTVFFDQVEATQRQCFSGIDGLTRRITSSEHNEDTSLHPAMSNNDDAVRREYWLSSCWSSAPLTFLGELHDCLILLVKYPFTRIYLLLVVSHVSMFSHICDDETQ